MVHRKRLLLLAFCMLLIVMAVVPGAIAIGLIYDQIERPILFKPNLQLPREITATGYDHDAEMVAEGELAEYMTILRKEETEPGKIPFTTLLKLPATLPPGRHSLFIKVNDIIENPGGALGGRTAVRLDMPVLVLSDEKVIKATLDVPNLNEGELSVARVNVQSLSTKTIGQVTATIDLFDDAGMLIDTLKTNTISLDSYEKNVIVSPIDADTLTKGDYSAKAIVNYDGFSMNLDDTFRVGTLNIAINQLPQTLVKDAVSSFDIQVESEWNLPLEGIWAEIDVGGYKAKTPTIDLPAWNVLAIRGFIELGDDLGAEAPITAKVFYEDEEGNLHTFTKSATVQLVEAGEVAVEPNIESPSETNWIRIGVIAGVTLLVILMLFNIFWVVRSIKENKR